MRRGNSSQINGAFFTPEVYKSLRRQEPPPTGDLPPASAGNDTTGLHFQRLKIA